MLRKFLVGIFVGSLVACGAASKKYSAGYEEQKSAAGVYTVKFTGNGHTSPEAVEQALHRRCAELTLREGYDYFTFYTKSRNDQVGMLQKSVPSFYGVIHLHRGPVRGEGFDAKKIAAEPLPPGITE